MFKNLFDALPSFYLLSERFISLVTLLPYLAKIPFQKSESSCEIKSFLLLKQNLQ